MLPIKTFLIPAKIITGTGSSEQAGEEASKLGLKKCLIVTDNVMVKLVRAGWHKTLSGTKQAPVCDI